MVAKRLGKLDWPYNLSGHYVYACPTLQLKEKEKRETKSTYPIHTYYVHLRHPFPSIIWSSCCVPGVCYQQWAPSHCLSASVPFLYRKLYAISEPRFGAGTEVCVACSYEIPVGFLVLMVRLRLCFLFPVHVSSFLLDRSANSICVSVSVLPADGQDVPPIVPGSKQRWF